MNIAPDHILNIMSKIAQNAGNILMKYFDGKTEVSKKADGSPVTIADKEAENYIITELKKAYPGIPAVGEESCAAETEVADLERYWMIDPLDGTRDFIQKSPQFTVNIALMEKGNPVSGIIYAPAMGLMYAGDRQLGSYRLFGGAGKEKLSGKKHNRPFTVTISRLHPSGGQEEDYLECLSKKLPVNVLRMSSSLKFCMVAEGVADLYFRAGRTMHWDTAAGHIIAKGAGASVIEWGTKKELQYLNCSLENPSFMVYNIERTPEELLNL